MNYTIKCNRIGNDTWLSQPTAPFFSNSSDYRNDPYFVTLAQNVAHNVLWTLADCEQARLSYDPSAEPKDYTVGFEYNYGWVWMPILAEGILLAILGVWIFLVVRRVIKDKKPLHPSNKTGDP